MFLALVFTPSIRELVHTRTPISSRIKSLDDLTVPASGAVFRDVPLYRGLRFLGRLHRKLMLVLKPLRGVLHALAVPASRSIFLKPTG